MKRITWFVLALAACSGDKDDSNTATADTGAETNTTTDTETNTTTDTETGTPADIAILGSWSDPFGSVIEVSNTEISMAFPGYAASVFAISQYDNDQMFAIAENDAGNYYYAGSWSRFDWVESGGSYFFCQSAYAAADEAEALATARPDDADLDYGCGGFSWSELL